MNTDFTTFLTRGIDTIISELQQYPNEAAVWKLDGEIKNTAGNLALHLTGSLNHFIGAVMAGNGYVRNREAEFSETNVSRDKIIAGLVNTKEMIQNFISGQTPEFYTAIFPLPTFGDNRTNHYVLLQMVAHLNYHLGQINYHRRLIGV